MGLLNPQVFISLAEETGLIVSIGEWVLRAACLQIKKWNTQFSSKLTIAVNVSAYQLIQKNIVSTVETILKETDLEPECLELEMTESHIFKNIQDVAEKLRKLKKMGVRLSIDDFGTGYASFSYLKFFPFDKIKIDQSFIKGIHVDKSDEAIVEAIITMSRKMGIQVLAEGVEKQEQIDFIVQHHGDQMQGYYYSPPINAEQCEKLLKKQNDHAKSR